VIVLKKSYRNYILIALLFFLFSVCTYIVYNTENVAQVKQVFNVADLKANCEIKEIKESSDKCDIKVYYPETKYQDLNERIEGKINTYIVNFKNEIENLSANENNKYQLQITFSSYEHEDYISYVFEIFEDFLGAHPNTTIWTVSYNIKDNKTVDINDLISKNKEILNILSEYTQSELKKEEKIQENMVEEMLLEGTKPKTDNFSNFAFAQDGLKIFFREI